jgi:poly(3-hydroxybutyrate) depolymerase
MLYSFFEFNRSIFEPMGDVATGMSKFYNNGNTGFGQMPYSKEISSFYDLTNRLVKNYEKPEFGIRSIPVGDCDVAIFERIELDKTFCELRRFKRFTDDEKTLSIIKNQPVVLIVAPMSGHHATLLRDTVRSMLSGHKIYITDWKNARNIPVSEGEFHLDDYIQYTQEFIRYLQKEYGNCHVLSVCQPTVPTLAAISLMASRGEKLPSSMIMMGGPIDPRKSPTVVDNLATEHSIEWFEHNVIYRVPAHLPGSGRRVYPGFLQYLGFVAMNQSRHTKSYSDYFRSLSKGDDLNSEAFRKFYDEYNAVLDMDANFYLDTIEIVFQKMALANGTWEVKNEQGQLELVKPQDIKNTAILTIEGELDDITGANQTHAALELCCNIKNENKAQFTVKGAGHYGIFSGKRWRADTYPKLRDFILANNK